MLYSQPYRVQDCFLTNWPAEVRNSGIEISSRARIIESKNLNLSLNF